MSNERGELDYQYPKLGTLENAESARVDYRSSFVDQGYQGGATYDLSRRGAQQISVEDNPRSSRQQDYDVDTLKQEMINKKK